MGDFIVSLAVQKLGDFLCDKVGLLQGVREDVEWLKAELEWMQCFIKDAEAATSQVVDNLVQKWISDISNVSYETVDVLEKFSLKVGEGEGGAAPEAGIKDRLKAWANNIFNTTNFYNNIGMEIKSLREKLQEISRRRKAYGIRNFGDGGGQGPGTSSSTTAGGSNDRLIMRPLRRTTSYVHEDDDHVVVGFEDEANRLLAELLKQDPRRCVVSIYGMGGLGKTTLAQKLYNSREVRGKFNCQAWVCVSQEYRTGDLLRSIMKSFNRPSTREEFEKLEKMTEEDLEQHLREFLIGHKYLVVLDDVWDKEAWKILRRAFPDSRNGSRVIITTRNKAVAIAADRTFVHELRFLSIEESWDLFCKKAFLSREREAGCCCSPDKEELGREMVGKCAGLPLAIIVLGGLLFHKKELEEWYKVKEHIWRHLRNDSIEISQLLSLSYYDLSSRMKWCFLYLGMFPEDYLIRAKKLMHLWIAEEFIPQEGGIRMEDMADEYFNELINRSLIQVTERVGRRIDTCKVHDLLRDLAVQKAREVNFFDIYDPRKYSAPWPQLLRCHRHAVHSHILNYFSLDHSNSRLRSLVFFNPDNEELEAMHLEFISKNFKSLRVVDLENVKFPNESQLPDMIGELIHLKFLCLLYTNISKLPPSIGNLKCLQFLHAYTFSIGKGLLPDEICKLTQLRYISGNLKGPLPVKNLTSLQALRYVDYKQWLEIDTVNLIDLRNLRTQNVSKTEDATYSIESVTKLKSLEELYLATSVDYIKLPPLQPLSFCQHLLQLWLNGRIEKLNELPQRLEMLWLQLTDLEEDPMPTLERLPNLRTLCLLDRSYNGKKMVCTAGGFRQLEYLKLYYLWELEEWQVEEGAMPIIRTLKMDDCPKLKMLPEKLKSVIIS